MAKTYNVKALARQIHNSGVTQLSSYATRTGKLPRKALDAILKSFLDDIADILIACERVELNGICTLIAKEKKGTGYGGVYNSKHLKVKTSSVLKSKL